MQNPADVHFLELVKRNIGPERYFCRLRVRRRIRQEFFAYLVCLREDRRTLNRISELADVATPGMSTQFLNRCFGKRQPSSTKLPSEELQKRPRQILEVLQPIAQGRNGD